MKHILFTTFLFTAVGFSTSFAQRISPELLNVINRLPSNQRSLVVNEYERFRAGPSNRSTSFSRGNLGQGILPSSPVISNEDALNEESLLDPLDNGSKNKLELLAELEAMITADISANDLELDETENGSNSISLERELILLDRKYDLKKTLREIQALQLFVISEEISEFNSKQDTELLPFGYSAFNNPPKSINRFGYLGLNSQISAIPSDYKVGPGDYLEIQLYGQKDAQYSVPIGRNGILQFPGIGPLNVLEQGNSFQSLKSLIKEKVGEQLGDGVRVSISLAELRQIKVFIAGEFNQPGQKLVTAGSSLFSLLLDSGGVNEIASLRSLTLKREGSPDKVYDLYDLLLKGERSEATLEEGDVIFLPTVKNRVWVEGEILRPAIYEITSDSTLSSVVELSGGFSEKAMRSAITLARVDDSDGSVQFKTLDSATDASFQLRNGDRLEIREVSESNRAAISVVGDVEYSGFFEWKEGVRVSGILKSISFYKQEADLNYALVRRQSLSGKVSFLEFSPNKILKSPNSEADLLLAERDRLIVLSRTDESKRERTIRPLIEELRQEGKPGLGIPSVRILGMIHFPGEYPYTPDMTVGDLVVAGGGMTGSAYTVSAELSRQSVDLNTSSPMASIHHTNLPSLLSENTLATKLRAKDVLSIKPIPSWSEKNTIEILGEVQFPGAYTFQKNETLKSVYERAGGFTQEAFPQGAVFTRLNLMKREEEQKKRLITQLETDLANISLAAGSEGTAAKAKSVADGLLARLKNSKSTGRLVIDLNEQVAKEAESSIVVRNGDKLFVPSLPSEVSVVGEVQFATSHLFKSKLNIKDYIQRSGGFTANADEGRVFAVKANGSVLTKGNSGWFKSSNNNSSLEAGDVIVVPIDLEKGRWLETLTSGTQVVYQLAVAAAAVNSF
jgi:polysaccharide biosynthesis/export protein